MASAEVVEGPLDGLANNATWASSFIPLRVLRRRLEDFGGRLCGSCTTALAARLARGLLEARPRKPELHCSIRDAREEPRLRLGDYASRSSTRRPFYERPSSIEAPERAVAGGERQQGFGLQFQTQVPDVSFKRSDSQVFEGAPLARLTREVVPARFIG